MKRELIVTADGRDRIVIVDGTAPPSGAAGRGQAATVEAGDGELRVSIDGVDHLVDARAVRPGTWSIVVEGRNYLVDLDRRRHGIAASVGASEVMLTVEDALHRRLAAAAGTRVLPQGELVRAPIAGKVIKLLVAIGEVVAAGTPVVVLEAMKMENELVAERGGTVHAVHKQAGQAVDTGDLLVELT